MRSGFEFVIIDASVGGSKDKRTDIAAHSNMHQVATPKAEALSSAHSSCHRLGMSDEKLLATAFETRDGLVGWRRMLAPPFL